MQVQRKRDLANPASNRAAPRFESAPRQLVLDRHRRLAAFNTQRLRPGLAGSDWRDQIAHQAAMRALEAEFVEQEAAAVAARSSAGSKR